MRSVHRLVRVVAPPPVISAALQVAHRAALLHQLRKNVCHKNDSILSN